MGECFLQIFISQSGSVFVTSDRANEHLWSLGYDMWTRRIQVQRNVTWYYAYIGVGLEGRVQLRRLPAVLLVGYRVQGLVGVDARVWRTALGACAIR